MGQADELRKVMGKKQKDKIPVYREKFIDGCARATASSTKLAEEIFAFIEPFAGYGFNKSHAAAYGWIAYQTAYLKANYPLQYFAALMSSVRDKTDKLVEYIDEAKKMGIAVLPPDVNASLVDFAVVGDQIRFGLAAVKGVGEGAVRGDPRRRASAAARSPICSICAQRVDVKAANRKVYEALIKCGALDTLPGNRAQLLDALDARARGRGARGARPRDGAGVAVRAWSRSRTRRSSRRCGRCPRPRRWSSSAGRRRRSASSSRATRWPTSPRRSRAPARSPVRDLRNARGRPPGEDRRAWSPRCGAR